MSDNYGQFYDAVEEFNFPESESVDNFQSMNAPRSPMPSKTQEQNFLATFFKAVEQASFPQLRSSDSLAAFSSRPSLASMGTSASASQDNIDEATFFQAMQTLIVTNSNSTAHLDIDVDERCLEERLSLDKILPASVMQFLAVYDDFMQNDPR